MCAPCLQADIQDQRRTLEAALSSPNAGDVSGVRAALDHVEQRASAWDASWMISTRAGRRARPVV